MEKLTDKALTLEISDESSGVVVRWLGRSTARDPRAFLQPVLTRAMETSLTRKQPLVLDFRQLDYLNSSTITPVVRLLTQVKSRGGRVVVRYRGELNWQRLNFTALRALAGDDGAIVIDGGIDGGGGDA